MKRPAHERPGSFRQQYEAELQVLGWRKVAKLHGHTVWQEHGTERKAYLGELGGLRLGYTLRDARPNQRFAQQLLDSHRKRIVAKVLSQPAFKDPNTLSLKDLGL